jgi:hypothetical protein
VPESVPTSTVLLDVLATARALTSPDSGPVLARTHEAAPVVVRQMKSPPVHRLAGVVGSMTNGVMNWNPKSPETPVVEGVKLAPPFVDLRKPKFWVSAYRLFVFVGSTAT